jgi:hypothetical protein
VTGQKGGIWSLVDEHNIFHSTAFSKILACISFFLIFTVKTQASQTFMLSVLPHCCGFHYVKHVNNITVVAQP